MKVLTATTCRPDNRIALCIIRSLAAEGAEVTVGGDRFAGRAYHSRYVHKKLKYPHPSTDPRGFQDAILHQIGQEGFDVLLPASDYIVGALFEEKDKIEKLTKLPLPSGRAVDLFGDKFQTIKLANELGISTPKTICCESVQELPSVLESLEYPLIVKPRKSTGGIGLFYLEKLTDIPTEFLRASIPSDGIFDFQHMLVQEYIPGEIHDVCLLFNRGEPRAVLTQKRLRMYPSKGGVGIYNVTTDEPDIKEQAIALLKALEWHGPAQVEFKREPGGLPYLMEVNGRFWGTLDLAVAAGINFPLLTCRMAMQGDINPVSSYKIGLAFRWPVPYGLLYAIDTGRWFRTIWEFFGLRRGVKSDLRILDALPSIAELLFAWERVGSAHIGRLDSKDVLRRIHSILDHSKH
jgi:predicted ATP-grasp superfamily ATP-dependent carboligase